MHYGIIFALFAMVAWAFDDFFIGKITKKIGSVAALFYLCIFGTIVLFPFIFSSLRSAISLWSWHDPIIIVLALLILVTLIAAIADFEALRVGKLSAIDPLYGFEIPITILLAYLCIGETLKNGQLLLIVVILVGMLLVSVRSIHHFKDLRWEKGVKLALVSILFMGGTNFLTGYGARLTSPLLVNWISYLGLGICTLIWLLYKGQLRTSFKVALEHKKLLLGFSIADVVAWTSFAASAALIPIGVTTAISEAYIALAVLLGLYVNKEKLRQHQFAGVYIIVLAVIALSIISG